MAGKRVISKKKSTGTRSNVKRKSGREYPNWDSSPVYVPHLEEIKELPKTLIEHPEKTNAYTDILESQCGAVDDSQPVEQYDGTLGVTTAFVNAHQGPVGQLQWNNNLASIYTNPGNVSGVRWGSGTLISNDLFLTAGHCFDQTGGGWQRPLQNGTTNIISSAEIAVNMHVNFNYQIDPSGILRAEQTFAVTQLTEYRLGGLDFAIVRLASSPGLTFGTTQVSAADAAVNDMVCIIGHPAGLPKRIEAGPVFDLHGDRIGYDDIDTLGGNSGSGILRSTDGQIVGVHTNGGCNTMGTGHNHGVRITSIIAQSPTLQWLTAPTLKFLDDGGVQTLKFVDDGGVQTLKFVDDGVQTLKFVDDGGAQTLKFSDDGGVQTLKHIDDVKHASLDKQPTSDYKSPVADRITVDPGVIRVQPGSGGFSRRRPFVMATPHHSMAWAREQSEAVSGRDQTIYQYEAALAHVEQQLSQGMEELAALDQQYRQLLEEYQALTVGKRG